MVKIRSLLLAAVATAPISLLAVRQTTWIPLNATPAMGHDMTPATQDVTKNTATFTITASVTDLDTFENNLNLQQTTQLAGNESDVSIQKDFTPNAINKSFDASTGKRTETYIFMGPWNLADSGDIVYGIFTTKGVDNMSGARHDNDTASSQSIAVYKYRPVPVGGGAG